MHNNHTLKQTPHNTIKIREVAKLHRPFFRFPHIENSYTEVYPIENTECMGYI